ncbi:MAG: hypothetical protein ACLVJK_07570 [Alistipes putredinis]
MVTFLGAALELSAAEVTPAIFEGYDCLYIEGYLVQDHELIAGAVRTAKACGLKVAIDLASFNVVEANLEFLRSLIQDYVDICFCQRGRKRKPSPARASRSMPCRCFRSCASWPS